MISFLCNPVKLFYTFETMPLRRGPDSSPDSQGLPGTTKDRKTPSSVPPWVPGGSLVSWGCLCRASTGARPHSRSSSSLPGSSEEGTGFFSGMVEGPGPLLFCSLSPPPKVRREISLLNYQKPLFLGWLWTTRSEHLAARPLQFRGWFH